MNFSQAQRKAIKQINSGHIPKNIKYDNIEVLFNLNENGFINVSLIGMQKNNLTGYSEQSKRVEFVFNTNKKRK